MKLRRIKMTRRIFEMPFDEVRDYIDNGGRGVVIPFGIIEPHGPHLPMGTDTLLALAISERIADKFGWLVAAPLNYGINNSLAVYPGASTIDESTYEKFVSQIIESHIKTGFSHIILNNGHGPNHNPIENAAKNLSHEYPNVRIFIIDWWFMDTEALEKVYGKSEGHAGCDETAAVLYFFPSLVKKDKFKTEASWLRTPGFQVFPAPATCLLRDNDGVPDFDESKAKEFMESVLEKIFEKIQSALEGFELNLCD